MRGPAPRMLCAALLALGGCNPQRTPPPSHSFEGLPVSGSLADARKAGFNRCIDQTTTMRCRRSGMTFAGQGPYEAAADLAGSDGSGGFTELVFWHDTDQGALLPIADTLTRLGWQTCFTNVDGRGDQQLFTKPGARVTIALDISYWSKRRLRIIPKLAAPLPHC